MTVLQRDILILIHDNWQNLKNAFNCVWFIKKLMQKTYMRWKKGRKELVVSHI